MIDPCVEIMINISTLVLIDPGLNLRESNIGNAGSFPVFYNLLSSIVKKRNIKMFDFQKEDNINGKKSC